jgi:[protein-PII] uridylyltransferase
VAPTPSDPSLDEVRAGVLRRPGLLSVALRDALSDAYDGWLRSRFDAAAAAAGRTDGLALAAVGGLGRREPAPYSDLDLVLLHDGSRGEPGAVAEAIWYPIWDSGLGLDHSVRTPQQAGDVARDDVKVLQGLLDLRVVAGDEQLVASVRSAAVEQWRGSAPRRAGELRRLAEQRWTIAGEGAFLLEPDLKEARGGLRDAQLLRGLALAQLVDYPAVVRSATTLLLDVRGELHRNAARAQDVLLQQEQDGIAEAFGLAAADGGPDRDELLRRVNHCARVVAHELDRAWRRIDTGTERRPLLRRLFGSGSEPVREGIARDVVAQSGEVVLARDADPRADPGLVLRAARAAATHELPLAAYTLDRFAAEAAPVPEPWPAELRDDFVGLLGTGAAAVAVLESLDLSGLLAPLIPEWDAVRSRAQRNPVHRFTVDRHLLETAAAAAVHTREVARPDLLLVGALLHDIGKGYAGDHSVVGARHAEVIATRMGFPAEDVAVIVALTRHHLLLPDTATRRDLDDPITVDIVCTAVGGSADVLELLHALSIADAAATGPGAWSDWKAGLIAELVHRAHARLGGVELPTPPQLDDEQRALAEDGRLAVLVRGDEVVVAVPDAVGALYRTAGVLALHSLDVRSATVCTYRDMAVNSFVVTARFGRMPDPALVRADLARAMQGELGLAQKLRDKERIYGDDRRARPPTVAWFDDEATDATVLEIRAEDRIGLLCRITAALERSGLDVRSARVSSLGGSAVDAFYVTTRDARLVAPELRRDVEVELRQV